MVKKVGKSSDKGASDDVFDTLIVESKNASTVVLMLQSKEEEILVKACDALTKFVDKSDDNKRTIMDLGTIDNLLQLICHDDKSVRRSAVMTLSNMSTNSLVRRHLKKIDGVIAKLLTLLAPDEDSVIHEFTSFCLSHLSKDYTTKAQIVQDGGIDLLLRLLASNDPDIQKNSIDTISQLLQDYQSKIAMRVGIQQIVDLLKCEYPIIQAQALVCLQLITQDSGNRVVIREIEAVNKIIDFIGRPDYSDLHPYAVAVLANCMDDIETIQLIKDSGGLQRLIAFITDVPAPDDDSKGDKSKKGGGDKNSRAGKKGGKGDDVDDKQRKADTSEMVIATLPEVKEHAAKALARAARNPEARKILHEQEIEKMLIILLMHDDIKVNISAALAIGVMAEFIPCRSIIVTLDGIEPLLKMLKSENDEARQVSSFALSSLNDGSAFVSNEIVRLKGIELLVAGLSDLARPLAAASCAACLMNACHRNIECRNLVAAAGAVQALVEPLSSSNTCLQSKASLALASLCCDISAREVLKENGGIEPLVKLLSSSTDEVRRNASWVIATVGSDPVSASEICRYGALDTLIEIQNSVSRKNTFSQLALDKLLCNNLSAKFAFTGKLDATDTILDEFYDVGKLMAGERFLSLDELFKVEINDKRPIILINNKSDSTNSPTASDNDLTEKHSKSSVSGRNSRSSKEKGSKKDKNSKTKLTDELESASEVLNSSSAIEGSSAFPVDSNLIGYYEYIDSKVLNLPNTKEQVITIGQFVADKMGGIIERGRVSSFAWQLAVNELKVEVKSNVINIGNILRGIHCHRALLFKILCDRCGVACSLHRGDYNRSWNEVLLSDNEMNNCGNYKLRTFVVDLVHYPGRLMDDKSTEALTYKQLT